MYYTLGGFVVVAISVLIVLLIEKLWFRLLVIALCIVAIVSLALLLDKKNNAFESSKNTIPIDQVDLTVHSMSSPFDNRGESVVKFSVINKSADHMLDGIKVHFEIIDCNLNGNVVLGKAEKYFYTNLRPNKKANFEERIYFRNPVKTNCKWSSRQLIEYTTGRLYN